MKKKMFRVTESLMRIGRFATRIECVLIAAFILMSAGSSHTLAREQHLHDQHSQDNEHMSQQSNALIQAVRQATARYQNVSAAQAAGYSLQFGCVSGPDAGAMGMHFINNALVADGILDVTQPEIVIYEPLPNGTLQLIGADYLVLADAWNATHTAPPQLMGQLFQLFDSPNRFGLPAFYSLHVWAWKHSPTGAFVNWNTNVSCNGFGGQFR